MFVMTDIVYYSISAYNGAVCSITVYHKTYQYIIDS